MEKWKGFVALVTGASSDIGAAVAENLVKNGMKVVGASRRIEKMEELKMKLKDAEGIFMPVKCDLAKDEEIYALFDNIKETFGGVDVCVNNAGIIGTGHELLNGSAEEWQEMTDVNIVPVSLCSKLTVKSIQERGLNDGHIININSLDGHDAFPFNPIHSYTATKFALRAFSEGLRQELRSAKTDIKVSVVSPGLLETDIVTNLKQDSNVSETLSKKSLALKPEDIALRVFQILVAPPMEVFDVKVSPKGKTVKD